MAFKIAIIFAIAFILSFSVVDSCSPIIEDSCPVEKDGKFGSPCDTECGCNEGLGLGCINSKCACKNTTGQVYDNGCVNISPASVCAKFFTATFSDDASAKEWRCDFYNNRYYGPSYDGTSKQGLLTVHSLYEGTNDDAKEICSAQGLKVVLSEPDDEFLSFAQYIPGSLEYWVGLTVDANGKVLYTNGVEFSGTVNSDNSGSCVLGNIDDFYIIDCSYETITICRFY